MGALGRVLGALEALFDASWPVQEANMPPEGSPRGAKIDSQRRLELKTRFSSKRIGFLKDFNDF